MNVISNKLMGSLRKLRKRIKLRTRIKFRKVVICSKEESFHSLWINFTYTQALKIWMFINFSHNWRNLKNLNKRNLSLEIWKPYFWVTTKVFKNYGRSFYKMKLMKQLIETQKSKRIIKHFTEIMSQYWKMS